MSAADFQTFYDFIEAKDNDGQPFHITEGDPGGATVYGWTIGMWERIAPLHGIRDLSMDNFKLQTKATLLPLTRATYWNGVQGDHLPPGVDVFWADFQFGSGRATRVLQGTMGLDPDGVIGPITLRSVASCTDLAGLLERFLDARQEYYDGCGFRDRWPGLYRRAKASYALARSMI